MGKIVQAAEAVEATADKLPLESKKFWALLVSILTVFVILFVATWFMVNPDLAAHAMDTTVWLASAYIVGQASQDAVKAYKAQ